MNYGLPYMGSKNKIAEWVVGHFPEKKHFYDLFAGGCAVTHCAMLKSKFKTFTINDISKMTEFFTDAISGKYADERRWISREDFSRLKDNDEYVRICWSFGNKGENYLYSKEIEPWKKALHHACVYGDFSLMEEFGIRTDGTKIDIKKNAAEYKEKYIRWYLKNVLKTSAEYERLRSNLEAKIKDNSEKLRAYLLEGLRKAGKTAAEVNRFLGTNGMAGHYFGRSQWEFPTREVYIKLQSLLYLPENYDEIYGLQSLYESLQSLQRLERLQSLESLQRLERLQSLQSLESLQSLQKFRGDYRNVKIQPDSLIYCDIPYKNTAEYSDGGFDHESFYDWAEKQREPVIISEYAMPEERFERIDFIKKRSLLFSGSNLFHEEGLFVPKTQIEKGIFTVKKKEWKQLELL
ncbi:DNA adenine methylase [uncultured Treponema sp.]|uniref:DNA adenine methylase n=1 Tax=uncultured Treponema sp. TaxID=162155 RepID=UPI002593B1E5|nr:DNA adenine methylase [uncultured Treponema sp.]